MIPRKTTAIYKGPSMKAEQRKSSSILISSYNIKLEPKALAEIERLKAIIKEREDRKKRANLTQGEGGDRNL